VSLNVATFELETNTPLLLPPPLDNTLIVQPLVVLDTKELNEMLPVPLYSIPYTLLVPPAEALELSTVNVHVLSFAFVEVVPPKTIPFKV